MSRMNIDGSSTSRKKYDFDIEAMQIRSADRKTPSALQVCRGLRKQLVECFASVHCISYFLACFANPSTRTCTLPLSSLQSPLESSSGENLMFLIGPRQLRQHLTPGAPPCPHDLFSSLTLSSILTLAARMAVSSLVCCWIW